MQTVPIFSGGCRDPDWVLFDNPAYCYASNTCLADEVHIVGRVLWTSRPSLSLRPASPGPLQNRTAVAGPFGARAPSTKRVASGATCQRVPARHVRAPSPRMRPV